MTELLPVKPLIEELTRKSLEISAVADQLQIPRDIKERFGAAWGKDFSVKADHIMLKTSKTGDGGRSQAVFDPDLIKCANAVKLSNAYNAYKKRAKEIRDAQPNPLHATEWKLLGEDRDDPLPSEIAIKIKNKITALTGLSGEEKELLNLFMTAEKEDREELLGAYKGLSRQDSFAPVAAKAIGMRVDYAGYINDIIDTLVENPSITKEILDVKPYHNSARKNEDPKVSEHVNEVFQAICGFCRDYDAAGEAWRKDSARCLEVRKDLAKINEWLLSSFSTYRGRSLRVKSSDGATNFPKVPWICLLPEGQEVNDGVYVSICFDRLGRGVVAGFAESATNPKGLPTVRRTRQDLRIDVNGPSSGTHFNDGFVNPEEIYKDNFDSNKLRDHIAKSLDLCLNHLGGNQLMPMTPDDKNNFVNALQKCGFVTQPGLPEAFLQSLIAKPFVILTGNSGTGKTKIAEMLATWLHGDRNDCHGLVAVGADWTDNRNVLGFVNHLRGDAPVYQSTHVLDLLMRARAFATKPFFLILDEMNLSHVERYFADFLSAMESNSSELHLHTEGGEAESLPTEPEGQAVVPRKLAIPANVFVIGTVNVDETTYMFSPKVLDRANVIEFRMPVGSVGTFMKAGKTGSLKMEYAGDGVAERFLSSVREARADKLPDPSDGDSTKELAAALDRAFDIMRDARLEFGFRTINEIRRYMRVDYSLNQSKSKWNWQNAFDVQLLQKILPKLSGSRRRLEELLVRLAVLCESNQVAPIGATAPANLQSVPTKRLAKPQFPFSYRKLCDMIDAVRRDQFVSFIQ